MAELLSRLQVVIVQVNRQIKCAYKCNAKSELPKWVVAFSTNVYFTSVDIEGTFSEKIIFLNEPTPASFCLFSFFSHGKYSTNTINDKSVDGVLGTRTQASKIIGTDDSTKLWLIQIWLMLVTVHGRQYLMITLQLLRFKPLQGVPICLQLNRRNRLFRRTSVYALFCRNVNCNLSSASHLLTVLGTNFLIILRPL